MKYISPQIHEKIQKVNNNVTSFLTDITSISQHQAKEILGRYIVAVEPNFIAWLAHAYLHCRSSEAKFALSTNIKEEIGENHQDMLRTFIKSADVEPDKNHFRKMEKAVCEMRDFIAKATALESIAVLATLENTSQTFIPYIEELAKKLGGLEFTYTKTHGEADIEHAEELLWALSHEEKNNYIDPQIQINKGITLAEEFLKNIFCVEIT